MIIVPVLLGRWSAITLLLEYLGDCWIVFFEYFLHYACFFVFGQICFTLGFFWFAVLNLPGSLVEIGFFHVFFILDVFL